VIDRRDAISAIIEATNPNDLIVASLGMISRELHAARDRATNFYMIGSMGLASAVGLGVALLNADRRVTIVEGDGSAMMSLGNFVTIGQEAPKNLLHIILDNESYESTGGQPSVSGNFDFSAIGLKTGYANGKTVSDLKDFSETLHSPHPGPYLLCAKTRLEDHQSAPPRVAIPPEQMVARFRNSLKGLTSPPS